MVGAKPRSAAPMRVGSMMMQGVPRGNFGRSAAWVAVARRNVVRMGNFIGVLFFVSSL